MELTRTQIYVLADIPDLEVGEGDLERWHSDPVTIAFKQRLIQKLNSACDNVLDERRPEADLRFHQGVVAGMKECLDLETTLKVASRSNHDGAEAFNQHMEKVTNGEEDTGTGD